jgi:hypothetical protein
VIGVLLSPAAAWPQQSGGQAPQAPTPRAPDFRLSASPDAIDVRRGATGQITVKVEPLFGFSSKVDLLSSLLYDTTSSFSPPSIEGGSGTAALSVSPSASAIKGKYVLSITGVDGGISHTISVSVTVK